MDVRNLIIFVDIKNDKRKHLLSGVFLWAVSVPCMTADLGNWCEYEDQQGSQESSCQIQIITVDNGIFCHTEADCNFRIERGNQKISKAANMYLCMLTNVVFCIVWACTRIETRMFLHCEEFGRRFDFLDLMRHVESRSSIVNSFWLFLLQALVGLNMRIQRLFISLFKRVVWPGLKLTCKLLYQKSSFHSESEFSKHVVTENGRKHILYI